MPLQASPQTKAERPRFRTGKTGIAILVLVVLPGLYLLWPDASPSQQHNTVYTAHRAPLTVSVLESGSIEAFESL
ncbi:MAG: hypothetical protein IT368_05685, partial [Candidatus Hydrogenedentes bacterium]|nr:hypothetical protein [Candidatus Hydrogenedentota bacterium]